MARTRSSFWTKLHQWIGLLIGIQVLLWIAGGLYMSAVPLYLVHGDHLVKERSIDLAQDALPVLTPDLYEQVLTVVGLGNDHALRDLKWIKVVNKPALKLHDAMGEPIVLILQNKRFERAKVLSKEAINSHAQSLYLGKGSILSTSLLSVIPSEASGLSGAIYRVNFDDRFNTSFYLDPLTGQVLKVRSDIWRLFDIFWMLHIMDYESREDFNNPLLIISALVALTFTVTGMALVFYWLRRNIALRIRKRHLSHTRN